MPKAEDKSIAKAIAHSMAGPVDLDAVGETSPQDGDIGLDVSDYMAMLDQQVSGSMYDEGPFQENPQVPAVQPTPQPKPVEVTEPEVDVAAVQKAYSESSREARRLAEENRQLKQYQDYIPILDELRRDPDLVQHVNTYLEGNDTTERVATRLGLPEDFIYDEQEAVNDFKSDSAKVLRTVMDDVVKENLRKEQFRVKQQIDAARAQDSVQRQRDAVTEKYKLSLDQVNELEDWAKDHKMSYEDIYFLKNRGTRDQQIANQAVSEVREQSQKMAQIPRTLASSGSGVTPPENIEKDVFNGIMQAMGGMQGVFDD